MSEAHVGGNSHPDHGGAGAGPDRHNDLDVGAIGFILLIGAVMVLALAYALQVAYYANDDNLVEERVLSHINDNANAVFAQQRGKQAGTGWVDPQKKDAVHIPIAQAMDLVVREQASLQHAQGARSGGGSVR